MVHIYSSYTHLNAIQEDFFASFLKKLSITQPLHAAANVLLLQVSLAIQLSYIPQKNFKTVRGSKLQLHTQLLIS